MKDQNENPTPKNDVYNLEADNMYDCTGVSEDYLEGLTEKLNRKFDHADHKGEIAKIIHENCSKKELALLFLAEINKSNHLFEELQEIGQTKFFRHAPGTGRTEKPRGVDISALFEAMMKNKGEA